MVPSLFLLNGRPNATSINLNDIKSIKGQKSNPFKDVLMESHKEARKAEPNEATSDHNEDQAVTPVAHNQAASQPVASDKASDNGDEEAKKAMESFSLKIASQALKGELVDTTLAGDELAKIDLASIMKGLNISGIDMDENGAIFTEIMKMAQNMGINIDQSLIEGVSAAGLVSQLKGMNIPTTPTAPMQMPMQIVEQEIIDQVAQKLSLHQFQMKGKDGVTLQLEPKELGALKIDIVVNKGSVSADILTQHASVKEILEKNQNILQEALAGLGMNIDQFSVNVGDFNFNQYANEQEQQGQFGYYEDAFLPAEPVLAMVGGAVRGQYVSERGVSIYV
jgi:flagellar hook-length control protein FliK